MCVSPQAVLDGEELTLPWGSGGLQVNRYSGLSLEVRSDRFLLFFTPQSNEFTVTLLGPGAAGGHTAGLCGTQRPLPVCSQLTSCLLPAPAQTEEEYTKYTILLYTVYYYIYYYIYYNTTKYITVFSLS